jgi:uncharacterized damage-inducible protein DinB
MFTTVDGFLKTWKFEHEGTSKLFAVLTDASLAQAVTPEGRTLGRLAWHITTTIPEMMGRTGLRLEGPADDAPVPTSARAIATAYEQAASSLAKAVRESWTDATLDMKDDMYGGEKWTRGVTLGALIGHQTHHRGQLTVLMRQAGLLVPGIFGPAREEWAQMGMPAPEI